MLAVFKKGNNELLEVSNYHYKHEIDKKCLYLVGEINFKINPDYTLSSLCKNALNEVTESPHEICGNYKSFFVEDGKFKFAVTDSSALNELYYSYNENQFVISDNIFDLSNKVEEISYNLHELNFFINHGYCNTGKTYFNEIFRIPPGRMLAVDGNNQLIIKNYLNDFKGNNVDYNKFKVALENTIISLINNSKKSINLFSGGVDSSVLLGIAKNIKSDTKAVTMNIVPELYSNQIDIFKSERIIKEWDIDHEIINIDFNEIDYNKMQDLVKSNPFASHVSLNFMNLFVSFKNNESLICGQNADSLYNLGPTDKFGIINRFLLSKNYLKMLGGVKGNNKYQPVKRLVDHVIVLIYKYFANFKIKTPDDICRFVDYFNESTQYLALSMLGTVKTDEKSVILEKLINHLVSIMYKNSNEWNVKTPDDITNAIEYFNKSELLDYKPHYKSQEDNPYLKFQITPVMASKFLFDEKIGSFITGGDHKVVTGSANLYNLNVLLPYSYGNMMHLFRNLDRNFYDIVYPKRFLYEYALKELKLSKSTYFESNSGLKSKSIVSMKSPEWEQFILGNTCFGDILNDSNDSLKFLKLKNDKLTLNKHMGLYWISNIHEMLEDSSIKLSIG